MKVCVYGAGAIGGHLAGRLAKGGAAVSVIARGSTLAALRANGIKVKTPRSEIAGRVEVTEDPNTLGVQDAVVVAVKAPAEAGRACSQVSIYRVESVQSRCLESRSNG